MNCYWVLAIRFDYRPNDVTLSENTVMKLLINSALFLAIGFWLLLSSPSIANERFEITNPLKLDWPWELTYRDFEPGQLRGEQRVRIAGEIRPIQVQQIDTAEGRKDRAWFIATLPGKTDEPVPVTIERGNAEPGISHQQSGDYHIIDNGRYEFRVRALDGKLSEPTPLSEAAHWIGGMRVKGQSAWDGRAWFEGNRKVTAIRTQVIEAGPVFVDMHIVYEFADSESGEQTKAMPLANSKQTHTFEPNQLPSETVAKRSSHYEVKVRFVAGDPWIDINERYHLPRDSSIEPWGIHQYWLAWGRPTDMPEVAQQGFDADDHQAIDTVAWVRWFEYDKFGGNTDQNFVAAEPRPAQKGRPFALLRPRWSQGGGGAQDFVLTAGGKPPYYRKGKLMEEGDPRYDAEAPAVGLVAAFASKWVGPYSATISAYALDGDRGRARFPLVDGERSGSHYGQRAYAILLGPRKAFDGTWKINSMVRRHTDWTLAAQMNKYILEWKRDPSLAGPSILVTRDQMADLRKAIRSGNNEAARQVREANNRLDRIAKENEKLTQQMDELRAKSRDSSLPEAQREQAKAEFEKIKDKRRPLRRELDSDDTRMIRLLAAEERSGVDLGPAQLWIERRYQDDFLNPTSHPTRTLAKGLTLQDLFADGKPIGGPLHAAIGYIFSDLDHWPGWKNGWSPGNPNFHTDKYQVALFAGAAMRDHPHAKEWVAYGLDNFDEDIAKVIAAPDGVGYECPGYAGYSINLQLNNARVIKNAGYQDPVVSNPLFAKTANWHRHLLTPVDPRLEFRHAAPIGDTHRWKAGLGSGFGKLATFYRDADPTLASELMGVWRYLEKQGYGEKTKMSESLIEIDSSIEPAPMDQMDWSSQPFENFGVIMRHGFGTKEESFLSMKAGAARGHYHNDDLSYHFYANGTPASLDYNCSYTPRGDHAALHNSMTFGKLGSVRHNGRSTDVEAHEQIFASGRVLAFNATPQADIVVAERRDRHLTLSPIEPNDAEFNRNYPTRTVDPIAHRRSLVMIKQDDRSKLTDYITVFDQTVTDEPQQLNIHLLARDATVSGNTVHLTGQHDKDFVVYFADADNLDIEPRQWHYYDAWKPGPGEPYAIRAGESLEQWDQRMAELMKKNNADSLPLPGWEEKVQDPKLSGDWFKQVSETDGMALMPPRNWDTIWQYGERQVWLRCESPGGQPMRWVLYAYPRGSQPPSFETLEDGQSIRVSLNGESQVIHLKDEISLETNGKTTQLLAADAVEPLQ
jgi:hypothetical protein